MAKLIRSILTTLNLTIKSGYSGWGIWEIIRESAQNAQDSHLLGHTMHVHYEPESRVLTFHNDNASIGRETLILGVTTKRGDSTSAGEKGEGYKVAAEAAMEHGIGYVMNNGSGELWTFQTGWSDEFNANLLQVLVESTPLDCNDSGVTVTLTGIKQDDWDNARTRLRFLNEDSDEHVVVSSDHGKILKGDVAVGNLYVKGIFVCKLEGENWTFGYDLNNVRLDRDRAIPSHYSLNRAIRNIIHSSAQTGALNRDQLWELFKGESQESRQFNADWIQPEGAHDAVHARFVEEHGENAVPVATPAEFEKAVQCGLVPVYVSPTLKTMLGMKTPDLDEALQKRSFEASCFYSPDELRKNERQNLAWAVYMVNASEAWVEDCVQIVDFYGSNIRGRHSVKDGERTIQLSRKVLRNRSKLMAVLIHEAAHIYGDDGTADHRAAIERIAGDIISNFASLDPDE